MRGLRKRYSAAVGVVALGLSLTACANVRNAWEVATGVTVSPNAVYLAANTADSAEIIATGYLRTCNANPRAFAVCAKGIESQVANAVRAVRSARNDLRAFLVAHPDALGASGLYDALREATSVLTGLVNTYSLAQVKA